MGLAHVATLLLNLLDAPKEPQRCVAGLFGRHPRGQVLLDLGLQMKLKLFAQLLLLLPSPEEGAEGTRQLIEPLHSVQLFLLIRHRSMARRTIRTLAVPWGAPEALAAPGGTRPAGPRLPARPRPIRSS